MDKNNFNHNPDYENLNDQKCGKILKDFFKNKNYSAAFENGETSLLVASGIAAGMIVSMVIFATVNTVFLYLFKNGLAQVPGKAHAAQGGQAAAGHTKAHGDDAHHQHQPAVEQHFANVAAGGGFGDHVVDKVCGDQGQQHFHHHFADHHDGAENQILFVFPCVLEQTNELHGLLFLLYCDGVFCLLMQAADV